MCGLKLRSHAKRYRLQPPAVGSGGAHINNLGTRSFSVSLRNQPHKQAKPLFVCDWWGASVRLLVIHGAFLSNCLWLTAPLLTDCDLSVDSERLLVLLAVCRLQSLLQKAIDDEYALALSDDLTIWVRATDTWLVSDLTFTQQPAAAACDW